MNMAILLFVIGVGLLIFFAIIDCLDDAGGLAILTIISSVIIFGYNAYMIHQCNYVIPAKIAMYEEENALIEEKVSNTVTKYMEYEKSIVIEVSPDDDAFSLVSLYPELSSDALVSNEIELYVKNNEKIKELKSEALNIPKYKFWIYFGK